MRKKLNILVIVLLILASIIGIFTLMPGIYSSAAKTLANNQNVIIGITLVITITMMRILWIALVKKPSRSSKKGGADSRRDSPGQGSADEVKPPSERGNKTKNIRY